MAAHMEPLQADIFSQEFWLVLTEEREATFLSRCPLLTESKLNIRP